MLEIHFCRRTKTGNSCGFFIINIIGECGSTLYVGLANAVPPTNTKFKPLLLPTQTGMPYTSTEHHISSLHSHFWVQPSSGSAFPQPDKNEKFLQFLHHQIIIRECSTLYVGMARTAPPTNTNFQLTFLLTRLQDTLL